MLVTVTSVKHMTDPADDERVYGDLIYTLTDKSHIIISVSACRDASIALSEVPGIFSHNTYEIVIGGNTNTVTVLRSSVRGANVIEVQTPGILDCWNSRSFWISWTRSTLSFGKGGVVEQNRVLYHRSVQHPINGLSVMTPYSIQGIWSFRTFSGNKLATNSRSRKHEPTLNNKFYVILQA